MFNRILNPSLSRNFFLFGPRGVGKSTLVRRLLPETKAVWIDLLDPELEKTLAQAPGKLNAILEQENQGPRNSASAKVEITSASR